MKAHTLAKRHSRRLVMRKRSWRIPTRKIVFTVFAIAPFVAGTIAVVWFFRQKEAQQGAVATIVACLTVYATFLFTSHRNARLRTEEINDSIVASLRHIWDELRKDDALLMALADAPPSDQLEKKTKLRLRLFLATLLDAYSMVVYYMRLDHFSKVEDEYPEVYVNCLVSLFQYPYMVEIWNGQGAWGGGRLRDEYDEITQYVVDEVINCVGCTHTACRRAVQIRNPQPTGGQTDEQPRCARQSPLYSPCR